MYNILLCYPDSISQDLSRLRGLLYYLFVLPGLYTILVSYYLKATRFEKRKLIVIFDHICRHGFFGATRSPVEELSCCYMVIIMEIQAQTSSSHYTRYPYFLCQNCPVYTLLSILGIGFKCAVSLNLRSSFSQYKAYQCRSYIPLTHLKALVKWYSGPLISSPMSLLLCKASH